MRPLLALHIFLLLLASTGYTVVTAVFGRVSLQWCYAHYSSHTGFGSKYVSGFSLPVICTYLAAFGVGVLAFAVVLRAGRSIVGILGLALSVIGLISFSIEGSHWVFDHHRSWLAFSPAMMMCLALLALLPNNRGTVDQSKPMSS